MAGTPNYPFSASASALGYLYQLRYALLTALKRMRSDPSFLVALETLDDIVFEKSGHPASILQTKHHTSQTASLSDASPDLWKTLGNWATLLIRGQIPDDTALYLVTTASAPQNSAAAFLRIVGRDEKKAMARLTTSANDSTNKDNAAACARFLGLDQKQRTRLVGSVHVIESSPDIATAHDQLLQELRWIAPENTLRAFLERLEGWWFARTIRALREAPSQSILSDEIDDTIADLREQFRSDNLPIDEDISEVQVDPSLYSSHIFVHQLRLFDASSSRLLHAARDYFRAFEQRSRWVRENLMLIGELGRYERRLVEEWEVHFAALRDELGDEATELQKKTVARSIYNWVETQASFPIRTGCTEPFVVRGSYQILSDRKRVGWHPDFEERLRGLLEVGI